MTSASQRGASDGIEIPAVREPADVLLTTGAVVTIRPIEPSDETALTALYARTAPDSLRLRFFAYSGTAGRQDVTRLLRPQSAEHIALIATDRDTALGVGCLEGTSTSGTGEFALLVDDSHHREGVGTLLLEHLVDAARTAGYRRLRAEVLTENSSMLHVIRSLGAQVQLAMSQGVVEVDFSLQAAAPWQLAVDLREGSAEYASLDRVLAPQSVAVVGASTGKDGVGHRILTNLVDGGFTGELFAVNRAGTQVCGVPGASRLADLPQVPDLVVIAVPAVAVQQFVDECAATGVYGVVIVSDGFAERGEAGRLQQAALVTAARTAGMRIVGPNCLGVLNADPGVRLNATFADTALMAGPVGIASQSGGVGLALLDYLNRRGIGVSTFVSMGNKADVSGNDLLMYWERNSATKVCVLYLESFGNARKFARIARRVARTKPIVAVTAGRSVAGARGALSHTAAAATPEVAIDALFAQAGVIQAHNLSEVQDIVALLTDAPLPRGRRLAIITNGGGLGALAADASAAAGLALPELSEATQQQLRQLLPAHAATGNPVDSTAGATPEALTAATLALLTSDEVDSVMLVHTAVQSSNSDATAEALAQCVGDGLDKPLLAVFLGRPGVPHPLQRPSGGSVVPCFAFAEAAAFALAAVASYGDWRTHPEPKPPRLAGVHRGAARAIVSDFISRHPDGGWLDTDLAASLLEAYGISMVTSHRAEDPDDAAAAATRLGYPVAVKSAAGQVLHRTDLGVVKLGLNTPDEVRDAVKDIHAVCSDNSGVIVQPMLTGGVEMAVGVAHDRTVGPIIMVGIGGVSTDLIADRSFRLPPLGRLDAHELIRSLRASALLFGYRGAPMADVKSLEDLILRVSTLAMDLPELSDLDLNPVVALPDGAVAVDAKIRLMPTGAPNSALRRLSPRS